MDRDMKRKKNQFSPKVNNFYITSLKLQKLFTMKHVIHVQDLRMYWLSPGHN